jgi:predicted type IV restriction endonuclease
MVQTLAVTEHITSLAEAEQLLGIRASQDPNFFDEWITDTGVLSLAQQQRLDQIKQRYLYHRQYGHLLENAVNFLVISPILELAGFYDPPFHLKSEVSVRFEVEDEDKTIYQGRIDALVVQDNLWVILVEAKRTSFNMTLALPQALAYLATDKLPVPKYAWVSNGEYSMFVKFDRNQYAFSDDFSLNRRQNELYDVLKILDRLKQLPVAT